MPAQQDSVGVSAGIEALYDHPWKGSNTWCAGKHKKKSACMLQRSPRLGGPAEGAGSGSPVEPRFPSAQPCAQKFLSGQPPRSFPMWFPKESHTERFPVGCSADSVTCRPQWSTEAAAEGREELTCCTPWFVTPSVACFLLQGT